MHNVMQGTKPFMFGIRSPEGDAYMDESCVDTESTSLEKLLSYTLNKEQEEGEKPYEVVPLFTSEQVAAALETLLSSAQSAQENSVFRREERYTVIKHADLKRLELAGGLSPDDIVMLTGLLLRLRNIRSVRNRSELKCLVVESTWPEYEPCWQALHLRIGDGDHPA